MLNKTTPNKEERTMQKYTTPALIEHGSLSGLTGADFTSSATDQYIGPDGNDLNPGNLTGSGPGCVDSNENGICDWEE
jgi:hypothetical protein